MRAYPLLPQSRKICRTGSKSRFGSLCDRRLRPWRGRRLRLLCSRRLRPWRRGRLLLRRAATAAAAAACAATAGDAVTCTATACAATAGDAAEGGTLVDVRAGRRVKPRPSLASSGRAARAGFGRRWWRGRRFRPRRETKWGARRRRDRCLRPARAPPASWSARPARAALC